MMQFNCSCSYKMTFLCLHLQEANVLVYVIVVHFDILKSIFKHFLANFSHQINSLIVSLSQYPTTTIKQKKVSYDTEFSGKVSFLSVDISQLKNIFFRN